MSNEIFADLPDVLTAEQLASALQLSKSGAYNLLNRSDFPTFEDRRTKNGDKKGSAGMAEQPHQQT